LASFLGQRTQLIRFARRGFGVTDEIEAHGF
jgi:hypothetical protein